MGSLAIQLPIANNAADAMIVNPLDELNDAAFVIEVLHSGHTEEQLEEELVAKATALGITIPRPPSPVERDNCPGAESDTTLSSSHNRSTSSSSDETADVAISSNQPERPNESADAAGPALPLPAPRVRSRSLNFSTYDKYLSQVEPNLCQPKFLKLTPAAVDSARTAFGIQTRKSYISIKNGLKNRVRWKKQPSLSCAPL